MTAAKCLVAWSHEGRHPQRGGLRRVSGRRESHPRVVGKHLWHRLNRGGYRWLNSTLHMAAVTRMTHDSETCGHVEKRRAEGKTDTEIRRCVKRYLARLIFRILTAAAQADKV